MNFAKNGQACDLKRDLNERGKKKKREKRRKKEENKRDEIKYDSSYVLDFLRKNKTKIYFSTA